MRFEPELIELVRQNESLYNPEHPDYKNMRIRLSLWDEIGRKLKIDPKICRRRWQNLRRFHRRIRIKTRLSGVFPKLCKQKQFEQLEFFEKFRKKNTKYDNMLQTVSTKAKSDVQESITLPVNLVSSSATREEADESYIESIIDLASGDNEMVEDVDTQSNEPTSIPDDEFEQSSVSLLRISPIPDLKISPATSSATLRAQQKLRIQRKRTGLSSLSQTCAGYLSAMGAKIDDTMLPDVDRYDLEKKVADLVYDVLEKYAKQPKNNNRFHHI